MKNVTFTCFDENNSNQNWDQIFPINQIPKVNTETRKQYTFFENDRCIVVYLVIFPTYFIMMTTRGLRFASNEERTKLLDDNDDNFDVSKSGPKTKFRF